MSSNDIRNLMNKLDSLTEGKNIAESEKYQKGYEKEGMKPFKEFMNETALDNRSITNFIEKNAPSGTRVNFHYSDDMVTAVFIGIMTFTSDDIKTLEKIKTKIEQNADVEDISLDKQTPTEYSIFVKHNSVKTSLATMKV